MSAARDSRRKAVLIVLFVPSDERLVWDEPVVIHCYASARDVRRQANQRALGAFCNDMGRATNQGEVGLVVDDVYHAIRFD
jgi:hypothetical protein